MGCCTVFLFHKFRLGLVRKAFSGGFAQRCWQLDPRFPPSPTGPGEVQWGEGGVRAEKNGKFNYDIKSGLNEIQNLPSCETEMRENVLSRTSVLA